MKNFTSLFLFLFLTFPNGVMSQINVEYMLNEMPHSKIYANTYLDEEVFTAGSFFSCKSAFVSRMDDPDASHWNGTQGYWQFDDLVVSLDETTLVASGFHKQIDDVPLPTDLPHVVGINLDGETIFETILPASSDFNYPAPVNIAKSGAGDYFVNYRQTFYQLSSTGELLSQYSFLPNMVVQTHKIVDIQAFNQEQLVIAIHADDPKLYWINNSGVFLDSLPLPSAPKSIWTQNEKLWVLTDSVLLQVSNNSIEWTTNNISQDLAPKGITGNGQNLFIWGDDLQGDFSKIVQIHPSDHTIENELDFNEERLNITGITTTETQLILHGSQNIGVMSTAFVKSIDILSPPVFMDEDIALSDIRVLGGMVSEFYETVQVDVDSFIDIYTHDAHPLEYEIDVTNNGSASLQSFSLASNFMGGFNCAEGRVFEYFDDINIPPGESQTFIVNSNLAFGITPNINPPNLFFSIFGPNHHLESDLSNNGFEVGFLVAVDDPLSNQLNLELYPNPAKDYLMVDFEWEENNAPDIQIVDVHGRLVLASKSIFLSENGHVTIKTNEFPTGIYFLRLGFDGQYVNRKFVVEQVF